MPNSEIPRGIMTSTSTPSYVGNCGKCQKEWRGSNAKNCVLTHVRNTGHSCNIEQTIIFYYK